jgi:hypothetical protein
VKKGPGLGLEAEVGLGFPFGFDVVVEQADALTYRGL